MTKTPIHAVLGPVQKLQFLASLAQSDVFSRSHLATAIVLADMTNSRTGLAYPSFYTLSLRSGVSVRQSKRAIKHLAIVGAINIVSRGGRGRSNRYSLNLGWADTRLENDDTITTTLVSQKETIGDSQTSSYGTSVTPESSNQSEHEAKIDGNDGCDASGRPLGAPSSHRPGEDAFPEFWLAFGFRSQVYEAEKHLDKLLREGFDYSAIIDGATRYKNYCRSTKSKRQISASNWLERQGWRDCWTHVEPPAHRKRKLANGDRAKDFLAALPYRPEPVEFNLGANYSQHVLYEEACDLFFSKYPMDDSRDEPFYLDGTDAQEDLDILFNAYFI